MRTTALEEHCLTLVLRELLGPQIHPLLPVRRWPGLKAWLLDLGEGRTVYDAYYSWPGGDVGFMLSSPARAGTSRSDCTPCG